MTDATALNRAHWEALAAVHGQDRVYDSTALVAGRDSLLAEEDRAVRMAVGDVAGLDVLHLQCHIGFDSISFARRGARVTGVDFSPAALAKAGGLATRCGVEVDWLQADATALPPALHGRFDLVYATIGVLCWIGDLAAWMRSARAALRPGGALVLVELHPLMCMIATTDPLVLDFPYADDGGRRFDLDGSYADPAARLEATASVEFGHSLGETVTAAIGAGLRVDALEEHMTMSVEPRPDVLVREDDGLWHLRLDGEELPVLYALIARAE